MPRKVHLPNLREEHTTLVEELQYCKQPPIAALRHIGEGVGAEVVGVTVGLPVGQELHKTGQSCLCDAEVKHTVAADNGHAD